MEKSLTKKQIEELKNKLLKEDILTKEKIEKITKEDPFLDPDHVNDNAAVDTDVREQLDHENIQAQVNTLQKKSQKIKIALEKITKNKYGICESCEKNIRIERLNLVPEAKYCIDCEKRLVK